LFSEGSKVNFDVSKIISHLYLMWRERESEERETHTEREMKRTTHTHTTGERGEGG